MHDTATCITSTRGGTATTGCPVVGEVAVNAVSEWSSDILPYSCSFAWTLVSMCNVYVASKSRYVNNVHVQAKTTLETQ